jgi:hypothetical protein
MTRRNGHPDSPSGATGKKRPWLGSPIGLVFCVFLAIAGALLWIEHRAHVLGALPLLLPLLICVGMHFFMHHGHGGGHGHGGDRDER